MVRKWQFIESKNRVYCNGRCITGQNIGILILALFLITVTSGLFFAFDCPYLTKELSPTIPVFAAILFLCVICCILRTACTDPGILPRATPDEILYLEKENSQNITLAGQVMVVQMRSGHTLQLKYCQTCKLFRPPRVSHCSLCNACIANFDHHCPWVGNCIGLRNYRYFYFFLFSLSILCVYIFVFNIVHIALRAQKNSTVADAIRETPATMIEALICFFSIWSVIDHTLGNSLRYVIMKNPDVDFCGYTIPHPSESKINFRIQSKINNDSTSTPAIDIFRQGLVDLKQMCSIVLEKYEETTKTFKDMETN
ncbi:unnamed protein product [Adineta steineri]|uniref:Palmitoyltransferase n=1 Tax=Adineta steineri TaxID=433720 RepID=A0A813QZZ9_9BILA|nr:unnamed protein product [Adineta steineri]